VDELRTGLELANDEELQDLTEILFRRKFNPLDYLYSPEPIDVQSWDRQSQLDAIEDRFRFLAADGFTVLSRRADQLSYRDVLLRVCRYLKISYSENLSTTELESEVFLHLLSCAYKRMPKAKQQHLNTELKKSISHSQLAKQVPFSLRQNPVGILLNGSGAIAIHSVIRPWILQQIARQIAIHAATYQVAQETLIRGGVAVATELQARVAIQTAGRAAALNTARYTAVRGFFAFLGPAMWAWFAVDLGWRAIATNYGRIIPVIFTLAQIRLTRTACYELA
jgi:uncharacterized protein YaaW (UPF0174 family)